MLRRNVLQHYSMPVIKASPRGIEFPCLTLECNAHSVGILRINLVLQTTGRESRRIQVLVLLLHYKKIRKKKKVSRSVIERLQHLWSREKDKIPSRKKEHFPTRNTAAQTRGKVLFFC